MFRSLPWRGILARIPLPMLALAASYGVYSFALLFVPPWVALVQAAAFELVYIGLAVVKLERADRKRATAISVGAVVVSVLYNTLAGWFHRQPDLLTDAPWYAELGLAILHGLPLALVAYLVADLLLHTTQASEAAPRDSAEADTLRQELLLERRRADDLAAQLAQQPEPTSHDLARIGGRAYSLRQAAEVLGLPETTLRRKLGAIQEAA